MGRRGRFHTLSWTHGFLAERTQIEYLVVVFDDQNRRVRLSLRQADILKALAEDEVLCRQGGCVPDLQKVQGYERFVHAGRERELS